MRLTLWDKDGTLSSVQPSNAAFSSWSMSLSKIVAGRYWRIRNTYGVHKFWQRFLGGEIINSFIDLPTFNPDGTKKTPPKADSRRFSRRVPGFGQDVKFNRDNSVHILLHFRWWIISWSHTEDMYYNEIERLDRQIKNLSELTPKLLI
jgi:hypothetical protein